MTTFELIEKIENAWGASTRNCNYFKQCVESIKWDKVFIADDEFNYCLGDVVFTTESLDPFAKMFTNPSFFIRGTKPAIIYIGGKPY